MQVHIEKHTVYQHHYYVEITDAIKAQLSSMFEIDLSNIDDWTKKDWEGFWEAIEELDYLVDNELIQEDEILGSYEEIENIWTEDSDEIS